MNKQILSTQFTMDSPLIKSQNQNQFNKQQHHKKQVYFSLSKYTDSIMIVINQTKNMGSIIKGNFLQEILPEIDQEQQSQFTNFQPQYIYQIKTLFGSTDIQFYEIITRMILKIIFEKRKAPKNTKVILNISLPVKHKEWEKLQSQYYLSIQKQLQILLNQVI